MIKACKKQHLLGFIKNTGLTPRVERVNYKIDMLVGAVRFCYFEDEPQYAKIRDSHLACIK